MSGLPKGWVEATVSQVGSTTEQAVLTGPFGASLGKGDFLSSGVPVFTIGCLGNGYIIEEKLSFISDQKAEELAAYRLREGDLMFSRMATVGRVGFVPTKFSGSIFNYHLMRLRLCDAVIEPRFFYYYIKGAELVASYLADQNRGATRDGINTKLLEQLPISLPPLAEQKRIVAKLDALNARSARARTELARIETLVSRYKQAVLSKAFSGELTRAWRESSGVALSASEKLAVAKALQRALSSRRGARTNTHPIEFDAVAAIPGSWAHAVIGVGADMTVGFAFKSEWFRVDGVKLLRGANIAPRAIDWSELKCLDASRAQEFARYLVEENDIVLAMDRPVISTGLKVARVAKQDAGCLLVQRVTRFRASEFVAQDFLWWFLNTQVFLAHSLHRATGSDLPHISGDDIATCPLPVPPLEEQHEIVRRIESAFAKIDRLAKEAKRALELVGRLDEAILAKAFHGELVPQDENDEPAEHLLARIRAEREAAPKGKRGRGSRG
ncbi:restriction endonuclease subunit S [Rhizobium phaseoli]|uniref:restriction endonuclease subunit S n=1 Tax=Rhizobium phaseoli TaxID=396 RepID=UPI000BBB3295|nr:restriction endonuclease subunit S [Rhizobium phaseoli]PCD69682.1 hypothetical protein CO648_03855 [Rhizobium phaseoli]